MLKRKSLSNLSHERTREIGKSDDVKNSKRKGRISRISTDSVTAESRLTEERNILIHARQNELDQVIDEHDDMVREAFHLEKFVTLLHYDPKEAKQDRSSVFQEYKANYDLLSSAPTAGPSRQTRRRATERLESLKVSVSPKKHEMEISDPSGSTLSGSRHSTPRRRAHEVFVPQKSGKILQRRGTTDEVAEETPSTKRSIKGKGRMQAFEDDPLPFSLEPSTPPLRVRSKRMSIKSSTTASPAPEIRSSVANGTSLRVNGKHHHVHHWSAIDDSNGNKGRSHKAPGHLSATHDFSPGEKRQTVGDKTVPKTGATSVLGKRKNERSAPSWQSLIKRVKLTVRKPPPLVSHPAQLPRRSMFGNSLSAFFDSYHSIDNVDYDTEELKEKAVADAIILNKIKVMKSDGRLLLHHDVALSLLGSNEHYQKSNALERNILGQPSDVWSSIIETIKLRKKESKGHRALLVTSLIAAKIRSYWESMAVKQDKARAIEEKRLRALAKSTMKMVTNEWKKAVFYIREQERLRFEAEQKRLGRQHLDAILMQSGQILEAQQYDFSKADTSQSISRSSGYMSDQSTSDGFEDDDDDDASDASDIEDDGTPSPSLHEIEQDDYDTSVADIERPRLEELDSKMTTVLELQHPDDFTENYNVYDYNETLLGDDINSGMHDAEETNERRDLDLPMTSEDTELQYDQDYYLENDSHLDDGDASVLTLHKSHEALSSDSFFPEVYISPAKISVTLEGAKPGNQVLLDAQQKVIPSSSLNLPSDMSETSFHSVRLNTSVSPCMDSNTTILNQLHMQQGNPANSSSNHHAEPIPMSQDENINDITPLMQPNTSPSLVNNTEYTPSPYVNGTSLQSSVEPLPSKASEVEVFLDSTVHKTAERGLDETMQDTDAIEISDSVIQETNELDEEQRANEMAWEVPSYLEPYTVARVDWDPQDKIKPPILLRGNLRPYQHSGLEWLVSLHTSRLNGILADEMGLGKTIQTISLLAHLACDRGIWGPHLIIVPTSVLLNWEMEFKKFLPGFKILSYHGTTKRRKELRQGWNTRGAFNVCVTSYSLASRDAHIFKRKAWYYMILDEAHMIKNFKSQRWNILLAFRSYRRLLLTGTPLQNNLTELWALLQFLMSGTDFANLREFGEWFSNPLEKAIEQGTVMDEENQKRVAKLHTVLRPYLLRRLKRDVEKELPSKYEHLVLCRLSKRQRFLYDEFMSRAQTQDDLKSGVYQKVANILMQLRKVCNHPDLFEVRPIVTSFAMDRSAIADFEIKELLVRKRLVADMDESETLNLDFLGLQFTSDMDRSLIAAREMKELCNYSYPAISVNDLCNPPPVDYTTISGYKKYRSYQQRTLHRLHCEHIEYINNVRCNGPLPVYSVELMKVVKKFYKPLFPSSGLKPHDSMFKLLGNMVKSYSQRANELSDIIDNFTFATPAAVARDLPKHALAEVPEDQWSSISHPEFDAILHKPAVKLQIAFPDLSLLQYDCGKLQELDRLLRQRKSGGHRVLIFTQMTKVLDILEIFLNFHGYLYLRLDGATKIEDRQYITERFNADDRVFAFIASSRSGGVGINLTGADTVIFYDSDFNPQMDRQCEDRAHRIGQIRDVHIYRFVSAYTVEEAMLRKANQKRSLDDIVIQKGEFDWRNIFGSDQDEDQNISALEKAMGDFEDVEDAHAARIAANEQAALEGEDNEDFAEPDNNMGGETDKIDDVGGSQTPAIAEPDLDAPDQDQEEEADQEGGGSISEYMLSIVRYDAEFFRDWKL